jgi:hypothetical protein
MDEDVKKLRLLLKFAMRVLSQLLSDLWAHYSSSYPLLLIGGVLRRIIDKLILSLLFAYLEIVAL